MTQRQKFKDFFLNKHDPGLSEIISFLFIKTIMSEKKKKKIKVTMFLIRRMIVDYDAYFLGRHLMEYFFLTLSASGVGFLLYITQ